MGRDDGALAGIAGVCGGQCHPVLRTVLRGQKRQIRRSGGRFRQSLQVVCGSLRLNKEPLCGLVFMAAQGLAVFFGLAFANRL
jgi:hypothetical protein